MILKQPLKGGFARQETTRLARRFFALVKRKRYKLKSSINTWGTGKIIAKNAYFTRPIPKKPEKSMKNFIEIVFLAELFTKNQ